MFRICVARTQLNETIFTCQSAPTSLSIFALLQFETWAIFPDLCKSNTSVRPSNRFMLLNKEYSLFIALRHFVYSENISSFHHGLLDEETISKRKPKCSDFC